RVQEAQQSGRTALPGARPAPEGDGPPARAVPPGQIADPYGVRATGRPGATPRTGPGGPGALGGPPDGPTGPAALEAVGAPGAATPAARWDDLVAHAPARRGPTTALAAERARQARM